MESNLRVCNVSYLNSAPYRALRFLPWVDYQEATPAKAAELLHEGECDLACIPLAEIIAHGGYQFLPFGIAARDKVDSVCLFAEQPVEELDEILIDEASHTSSTLLRVLLQHTGRELIRKLRFTRLPTEHLLDSIRGSRGGLIIGDRALAVATRFPVRIDLAELWRRQTNLPFVFALWAYYPAAISEQRKVDLLATLRRGVKDRRFFARCWAEEMQRDRSQAEHYVEKRIQYEIDEALLAGARSFASRAEQLGILPDASLSLPSTERPSPGSKGLGQKRAVSSPSTLLQDASDARRLSLADFELLAQRIPTNELLLAAEQRRRAMLVHPQFSYQRERQFCYTNISSWRHGLFDSCVLPGSRDGFLAHRNLVEARIGGRESARTISIRLRGALHPELSLSYLRELLYWIAETNPKTIRGFSAEEISYFAENSGVTTEQLLLELKNAGLSAIDGADAGILIERYRAAWSPLSAQQWLRVHRAAHRVGLLSSAGVHLLPELAEKDLAVHLHKLRQTQDETLGFSAFTICVPDAEIAQHPLRWLRMTALCRLFLDNIAQINVTAEDEGSLISVGAALAGASDIGPAPLREGVIAAHGRRFALDDEVFDACGAFFSDAVRGS